MRFGRLIVFGLQVLVLPSCAATTDGSYWQCREGRWVAVGSPRHPVPFKECGADHRFPVSPRACAEQGGTWGPIGIFSLPACSLPTADANRVCADSEECMGLCAADLSPAEWSALMHTGGEEVRPGIARTGKCSARIPVTGCHAKVEKGAARYIVCLD